MQSCLCCRTWTYNNYTLYNVRCILPLANSWSIRMWFTMTSHRYFYMGIRCHSSEPWVDSWVTKSHVARSGNVSGWYGVPYVKVFRGQKLILHVICQYSFMLHPKMFAPCPNLSSIRAILDVTCLISLR